MKQSARRDRDILVAVKYNNWVDVFGLIQSGWWQSDYSILVQSARHVGVILIG